MVCEDQVGGGRYVNEETWGGGGVVTNENLINRLRSVQ